MLLIFCTLILCACGGEKAAETPAPEETVSPEAAAYQQAQAAWDEGDYAGALEQFTALGGYSDSAEKAAELEELARLQEEYDAAEALLQAGDGVGAYRAFGALGDFKDSQERQAQAAESPAVSQALAVDAAQPGEYVIFGEYEQDNDLENGPEPLEWLVLDKAENRTLLLCRYGINAVSYYPEGLVNVTWETSQLRQWFNSEFLNDAFTSGHQALIADTEVINEDNPLYPTDGGNDTVDKVFALSIAEVAKYFPEKRDNWTVATEYAKAQGAWSNWHELNPEYGNCWWWTRSPGNGQQFAAIVESDGNTKIHGDYVFRPYGSDRPAMWVDMSALKNIE